MNRYGITQEQYDEFFRVQEGLCAICKKEPIDESLSVDHDHSCCPTRDRCCGKCIRGLLCGPCNRMLGLADDDVERLAEAIAYLERQGNWRTRRGTAQRLKDTFEMS
jgi:hypothetical protein